MREWPRHYAYRAYEIYKESGKDKAIKYIKTCPKDWRRLIYSHVKNFARING